SLTVPCLFIITNEATTILTQGDKVILDTNIFHNARTDTSGMQMLLRLVKSGCLQLVISEVVAREYITKRISESEISKDKILSESKKLKNTKVFGNEYHVSNLDRSISEAIQKIETEFYEWASQDGIEIYKIKNTLIEEIFDDYFIGKGAFKKSKSRDDFPDAVILDCIKRVSLDFKTSVITKDQHLVICCNDLDGVKTFNSLDSLFEEVDIGQAIIQLDSQDGRINGILNMLESSSVSVEVEEYIKEFKIEEYLEKQFYYNSISLPFGLKNELGSLSNDSVQAVISEISDFGSIYVSKAKYLGGDRFSLSINIDCLFDLHMFVAEGRYEMLDYSYRKELNREELLVDGEEHIYGFLKGNLESSILLSGIDLNLNHHALEAHLSYLGQDKCVLSVDIESDQIIIDDL
ncbi:PIN domain-containing protein, partial [Marinomonas arctica]|uniref:PIN domain-containing protein n=2 Tax=Marinomonas TaxID=28253 RepID=UPI0019550A10